MITYFESVLYRIKESPIEHLGRRAVSLIDPYFIGYDFGRSLYRQGELPRKISREGYRKWLDGKVHLCRQNVQSFCLLLSEDERDAFDLYFAFYDFALEECGDEGLRAEPPVTIEDNASTLTEFLTRTNIRERPAMYFGNNDWISSLWVMCNGFLWAEKDLGISGSSDAINMELFQVWLDERYPIAKGRTWDRLFDFLALHSNDWALREFYEHFEMFLEGDAPDALSKANREILRNVQEQVDKETDN